MELCEWTELFVKHHDLMKKEIIEISKSERGFFVKKHAWTEEYLVGEFRNVIQYLNTQKRQTIVCPNSRDNFEFLLHHWNDLSTHPTLKIIFANPVANERWIVSPHHHALISDDESFKEGLESMYSSVLPV